MKRLADIIAPLVLVLALLGVWEAACRVQAVASAGTKKSPRSWIAAGAFYWKHAYRR